MFGFANRIESGLMPLGAPPNSPTMDASQPSEHDESASQSTHTAVPPSEAELETLAEKMLNGEYEEVVDASTKRPNTTGGVFRKIQQAAQVVSIAGHLAKRGKSGSGKERLGELVPVPVKHVKEDVVDRSFVSLIDTCVRCLCVCVYL